jgi:hypothetical protein
MEPIKKGIVCTFRALDWFGKSLNPIKLFFAYLIFFVLSLNYDLTKVYL